MPGVEVRDVQYQVIDTVPYKNRPGSNPERDKKNPFDLKDPKSVEKDIEYDPVTGEYILKEKIGTEDYKSPRSMTFEEFLDFKGRQQDNRYFKDKSGISSPKSKFSSALDPLK